MAVHRIKGGIDLPISGAPQQTVEDGRSVTRVAVVGDDTPGLRARLSVAEGDTVQRGQLLFEDRVRPGVRYTAPGAGRVAGIFRGHRRMLRSVVIQLSQSEEGGSPEAGELVRFEGVPQSVDAASPEDLRGLLVESGLWTALRTRPFGKVPDPTASPFSVFVNAADTNPHAPDPDVVVGEARDEFQSGLRAVARLFEPTPFLCVNAGSQIPSWVDAPVQVEEFKGRHPAGNVGVHIHTLAPVSRERPAWHLGHQDVIAIGRLLATAVLPVERIVSIAGPMVQRPRLLRTRMGASLDELTHGELESGGDVRVISGSVFSGKRAAGPEFGFLGRYHNQVAALAEGRERKLLGWAMPGANDFSLLPVFVSKLLGSRQFDFTTDTNGSHRALMPIGTYERMLPMDIIATYLLRSLVVGDVEQAVQLGALELDEEDLALCTFACPGKTEFGPYLRQNLERIEKEG